jgi:hypothetical protein
MPAGEVAATSTEPMPLATASPSETPAATPTPQGPTQLTVSTLHSGKWRDYFLAQNSEGDYEAVDSAGGVVPDILFLDDGTAELRYRANNSIYDVTVAFQAISVDAGGIVAGLWGHRAGHWSMETYAAPTSEDETVSWRSLAVLRGHEKEEAMIASIFMARDLALSKAAAYDPMDEFEDLPSVTVNFRTIEDFDPRPRKWVVHRSGFADGQLIPSRVGGHTFEPISRSSEVIYSDYSTNSYVRPMQVALGQGWFNIRVYEKEGELQPTITHVPTVALNADGTLVHLSTIIRQADLPSITGLLTIAKRGQLGFRLNSITVKSDRYLADQQLLGFAVEVNQEYFSEPANQLSQVPSTEGYGWYSVSFPTLPKQLQTSFLLFSSTIR